MYTLSGNLSGRSCRVSFHHLACSLDVLQVMKYSKQRHNMATMSGVCTVHQLMCHTLATAIQCSFLYRAMYPPTMSTYSPTGLVYPIVWLVSIKPCRVLCTVYTGLESLSPLYLGLKVFNASHMPILSPASFPGHRRCFPNSLGMRVMYTCPYCIIKCGDTAVTGLLVILNEM